MSANFFLTFIPYRTTITSMSNIIKGVYKNGTKTRKFIY